MKEYLGDSVYADFDGYHVILTTENGYGPSNTIALEPPVINALNQYVLRCLGNAPPTRDPVCRTDVGDGSTMYDDRPRPGA